MEEQILTYTRVENGLLAFFNDTNKLTTLNSKSFKDELIQQIRICKTGLFLDFSEIKFIDSAGFQALLALQISAILCNIEFVILKISKEVLQIFTFAELNLVFDIRENINIYRKAS